MTDPNVSRRDLLTTAAGLTLAAAAARRASAADAPAPAAAADAAAKPITLRWGIIGTGTRGGFTHLPLMKEAPESKLVALCDVSEERLAGAAKRAGEGVTTYADYQKLLANPDVNAVVIATPNLLHREMLLAALQAGKHVLCEKPAGAGPADAVAMKQAADAARTVVMFGMQYRNNLRHKKIQEIIDSGKIGKPRYIVQNCSRGDWNLSPNVWQYSDPKVNGGKAGNWRFSQTASGGTLNEFSCHYLDLLHGMAGSPHPDRVSCDGGISVYNDGRDTWDHATVTLLYPNGVTAIHTLSLFGPGRNDVVVMGEEGTIETKVESKDGTKGEVLQVVTGRTKRAGGSGPRTTEVKPDAPPAGHSSDRTTLQLYEDFLACVMTGKKPDASPERAIIASRTCWLAELASERRCEVKWEELGSGVARG
jgi:predicted dehydrogenase